MKTPEEKAAYQKEWRAKNKDKLRAYEKNRAQTDKRRALTFARNNHGVTRAQADEMIEAQSGLCLICKLPARGKRQQARLQVDHCHTTGLVRGMLCAPCNTALGLMKSPETLRAAADYLEAHGSD